VIGSFFAGTELLAPGLADAGEWLPGAAATTVRYSILRPQNTQYCQHSSMCDGLLSFPA
jgi:hypothetical protein